MHQSHRFLIAALAALLFSAPGAFANGGTKTPLPHKAKIQGPYRAKKKIKKSNIVKPSKPFQRRAR
jgi:hypothetical protein